MKLHSRTWQRIYKPILWTYVHFYLNLSYRFEADLPPGPKIFAVNHPTVWDAFPILIHRRIRWLSVMVEDKIWSAPVWRFVFTTGDQIKLWRDERSARSIEDARLVLSQGDRSVLIAPEGHRTTMGTRVRAKRGVVRLAVECRVPIVPIGVWLAPRSVVTQHFRYDYQGKKFVDTAEVPRFRARYAVTVGRPISFERWYHHQPSLEEAQGLADQVLDEIRRLSEESRRTILGTRR
jgi:1-acyl-sn-glycerol-3-phosphate acyltransferase